MCALCDLRDAREECWRAVHRRLQRAVAAPTDCWGGVFERPWLGRPYLEKQPAQGKKPAGRPAAARAREMSAQRRRRRRRGPRARFQTPTSNHILNYSPLHRQQCPREIFLYFPPLLCVSFSRSARHSPADIEVVLLLTVHANCTWRFLLISWANCHGAMRLWDTVENSKIFGSRKRFVTSEKETCSS